MTLFEFMEMFHGSWN